MRRLFPLAIVFLLACSLVLAADFTPQGNVNLRGIYNISNASNVCIGSDCRTSWPAGGAGGGISTVRNTDARLNVTNGSTATINFNLSGNQDLNETDEVLAINTSANIKSFGFNVTTELKTYFDSFYLAIGSLAAYLNQSTVFGGDVTGNFSNITVNQKFNDSTSIANLNSSVISNDSAQADLIGALKANVSGLNTSAGNLNTRATNLESANVTLNLSVSNLITNASNQQTKIDATNISAANLNTIVSNIVNLTLAQVAANIGNWTADRGAYINTSNGIWTGNVSKLDTTNVSTGNLQSQKANIVVCSGGNSTHANVTNSTAGANGTCIMVMTSFAAAAGGGSGMTVLNLNSSTNSSVLANNSLITVLPGSGISITHVGGPNPNLTITNTGVLTEVDPAWSGNATRVTNLESANVTTNTSVTNLNTNASNQQTLIDSLRGNQTLSQAASDNLSAANVTLNLSVTNLIGRVNSINATACTGGNATHANVSNATAGTCVMVALNPGSAAAGGSGMTQFNLSTDKNTSVIGNNSAINISASTGIAIVHTGGANPNITISNTGVLTEVDPAWSGNASSIETNNSGQAALIDGLLSSNASLWTNASGQQTKIDATNISAANSNTNATNQQVQIDAARGNITALNSTATTTSAALGNLSAANSTTNASVIVLNSQMASLVNLTLDQCVANAGNFSLNASGWKIAGAGNVSAWNGTAFETRVDAGGGGYSLNQSLNTSDSATFTSLNITNLTGDAQLQFNSSGYCWRIKMESTEMKIIDCGGSVLATFNKDSDSLTAKNVIAEATFTGAVPLTAKGSGVATVDLFRVRNSSDSTLFSVGANGSANFTQNLSVHRDLIVGTGGSSVAQIGAVGNDLKITASGVVNITSPIVLSNTASSSGGKFVCAFANGTIYLATSSCVTG